MEVLINDEDPLIFDSFNLQESSEKELLRYAAEYFSPELKISYYISMGDSSLVYHQAHLGTFPMKEIKQDIFGSAWPMNLIKFQRDKRGNISGFLVSNGRVNDLYFKRR